jgi:hypothetical protein
MSSTLAATEELCIPVRDRCSLLAHTLTVRRRALPRRVQDWAPTDTDKGIAACYQATQAYLKPACVTKGDTFLKVGLVVAVCSCWCSWAHPCCAACSPQNFDATDTSAGRGCTKAQAVVCTDPNTECRLFPDCKITAGPLPAPEREFECLANHGAALKTTYTNCEQLYQTVRVCLCSTLFNRLPLIDHSVRAVLCCRPVRLWASTRALRRTPA